MEVKTLDSLCLIITDGAHHSPKEFQGGIPMFSVKDMTDFGFDKSSVKTISKEDYKKLKSSGCEPEDDDVLIAKDGSVMKHVFKYKHYEDCVLLSSIAILRPNSEIIDPDYLVYSILNPKVKGNIISNYVSGSGVPRIVLKDFKKIEIKVPEIRIQKKVSKVLNQINSKIELNQKMNETLEEIAKTLFKSWFIDFDPVRAKAEGRPTGLSKEISDLFPDSFENSELGEMPSGWKVGNLGNLCVPKRGKVITKAKVEPGNFPVVAGGIKPPYYHSESNAESPIVTISASGTAGFVNLYYEDIWASDCSYINKEITDNVFFIYSFLKINQQRIYDLRHGAVQQHVYPKDLIELPIFLSSNSLIEEYEKIATSFHGKISLNIQESKHLEAIRDTLLPRLISGKLQIPDAENLVKEAGV